MRSFWAIAGLAVAVIFTWRALRSPNGSQRRQPKRRSPSHNNENSLPSGVSSSSQDSRTQNATNEFFQPANVNWNLNRNSLPKSSHSTVYCLAFYLQIVWFIAAGYFGTNSQAEIKWWKEGMFV